MGGLSDIIANTETNRLTALSSAQSIHDDGEKNSFIIHHAIHCNVQIESFVT